MEKHVVIQHTVRASVCYISNKTHLRNIIDGCLNRQKESNADKSGQEGWRVRWYADAFVVGLPNFPSMIVFDISILTYSISIVMSHLINDLVAEQHVQPLLYHCTKKTIIVLHFISTDH